VNALRALSLIGGTLAIGVMAGVFFTYSVAVMPGLRRTDDRTFVGAFQSIDRSIERAPTLLALFGGLACVVAAVALHFEDGHRSTLPWLIAAAVLYAAVVVITGAVNVPRNTAIKAAGDPAAIDLVAVRARFDEAWWLRWNHVRLALNLGALGCMGWALVLFGRTS
jgi:uncharacterized membrane protein